ncbi:tyrosine--tRNA ligase [Tessaracoccus palaemonis]|uniref:Tyrosine--tRNA ligase n=1 Tax=Tessaracoccus palaemonis TaxID=2829499 RepID=A0ABX8SKI3_9ACTN|nr:tyrosine--tRNA ligase [Tessaracoccus palaemonis]QXT63891.1 tyrosine--tRNA ligase [Tessaracoccus palaemonis]
MNATLDDLAWRGLIAHSTDRDALAAHLDEGPVKFYVGFDPTAQSVHTGNLVQLLLARRLQQAGHRPFMLVGGATGLIGDPKEAGERVMNSVDVVHGWVDKIRAQVERFVSFEGDNAATMVNNYDWTSQMSVLDFLRDVGKHFPVNRMLARDVVARRLESGISYTEFSYVLLQSMDYRELNRRHGVTLQTGGSDQWGNLTAGVELIRRSDQGKVHAMATPLLTKADGTKFGKTESGTVWLDENLTSVYAFHQFFLNAEDAKVIDYLKVFSFRSREEIETLEQATIDAPYKREAQRALADDVTDLVHGRAEREAAAAAAQALFGRGELQELSAHTLDGVVREVKGAEVDGDVTIVDALVAAGLVDSKGAARRAVAEGGAYLNNEKVTDPELLLTGELLLHGRYAILRRGRKTVGAVVRG